MADKSAAAAVKENHTYSERLPDKSTIFSAEMHAIFLALDHVETSGNSKFVILSDSKSVLQSLQGRDWTNPLTRKVLERHNLLREQNKKIKFFWVPSHIGIKGNEDADSAAKEALSKRVTNITLPYSDYRRQIKPYIYTKWQQRWDECIYNRLHCIQPILGTWKYRRRPNRKEESVLSRIRIGHTYFTHSYLLKREDQPECIPCQCPLSVRHIMVDCVDFAQA